MQNHRAVARIVGILFIVASVTAIVGGTLAGLPLQADNYLAEIGEQRSQIVTGVLLLTVQTVAVIGIAVLMYPTLKNKNEGMALGYVGARTIEGVLVMVGGITALMVFSLGESYGQVTDIGVKALGDTLVQGYDWAYWLGPMLFFSISALILYTMTLQMKIIPTWLSIWGLIGGSLLLVRTILEMYGIEFSPALQGVLAAPIGIQEMVLAVWLIVKGLRVSDPTTAHHGL